MLTGKVRNFILQHLVQENKTYWGHKRKWIETTTDAWMDDRLNSNWRYDLIQDYVKLEQGVRILDMACGCGTFVFAGLLKGYDVWGIDPEDWKHEFNKMKIELYGYPKNWDSHFINGQGENLPFSDDYFDIISSYQTLEHVSDVEACLKEMLRTTTKGGHVFLHFPDYRSTFEGHYQMAWLPLFYKPLARIYLKLRNRPVAGLNTLNYITKRSVLSLVRKLNYHVEVIDLDISAFQQRTERIAVRLGVGKSLAAMLNLFGTPVKRLFRSEKTVGLILRKV